MIKSLWCFIKQSNFLSCPNTQLLLFVFLSHTLTLTYLFNHHPASLKVIWLPCPDWKPFLKCVITITIERDWSISWRLPDFHSLLSPSDECLLGRQDHSSVFHGDVSFSFFPGGLPLWRAPRRGCRAAVPPRSSSGRHHTQREKARRQQQQRCSVQMWSCRGASVCPMQDISTTRGLIFFNYSVNIYSLHTGNNDLSFSATYRSKCTAVHKIYNNIKWKYWYCWRFWYVLFFCYCFM